MGAGQSFQCPIEFKQAEAGFGCTNQCPTTKGWEVRMVEGVTNCVFAADPKFKVKMNVVPMIIAASDQPPPSYTSLPSRVIYEEEYKRFSNEMIVVNGQIDKQFKLNSAFKTLQDAENVRDQAPDAYNQARVAYYTLLKGDTWINEERNRIAQTEAQPVVNDYVNRYTAATNQSAQTRSTIGIVNSVKDKMLSIQDDMQFSVDAFQRHVGDIRNQINIERKKKQEEMVNGGDWIEILMNFVIVFALIAAIFYVYKAVTRVQQPTPLTLAPT
jgi:hypothetical protein